VVPARHNVQPTRIAKVGPAGEAIAKEAVEGKYDLIIHGHPATARWASW
jgi:hypothetical protein